MKKAKPGKKTRASGDPELAAMLASLAAGAAVSDWDFDRLYAKPVQKLSRIHWTPVAVAQRAAAWLVPEPGAKILDVGSGCGKFCLVGAATSKGHFTGIEHHAALVDAAKALVKAYRLERLKFIHGDALAADWAAFDGFYLYNPFAAPVRLAAAEPPAQDALKAEDLLQERLANLRLGTRVVVHHGSGGRHPPAYRIIGEERHGSGLLACWQRC